MISGGELLEKLRRRFPSVTIHPSFPFLRARIVSADFANLSDDDREELFARSLSLSVADLRSVSDRLFLRFDVLAGEQEDRGLAPKRGETWLGTFSDLPRQVDPLSEQPQVVHFYGFKGGQGRSTLLAFLATELAREGINVLAVDLDAEAPSLDLVFGLGDIPEEASIVGLRGGVELAPISLGAFRGGGQIALIGFRPSAEEYDLDATALAFEASVNAPSHERLATALRGGVGKKFDVILIDHRTGLGPTVPAWVRTMPGPIVVMDRLDGQSRRAVRDVRRIWAGLPNPGVLVSYVPPSMSPESMREHKRGEAWPWLEVLALAKSERAEEPLGAEDVEDHWILWPDDNAFRRGALPQHDDVGGLTSEAIHRLREILNLAPGVSKPAPPVDLHPSGATDQGLLIITDALRELQEPNTPYRFIFGRKGTGKTRLVHELAYRKVGEPLVVAEDEELGGLSSQNPALRQLVATARKAEDPEGLWWTLVLAALRANDTKTARLHAEVSNVQTLRHGTDILKHAPLGPKRILLIDGLETMTQTRGEAKDNIQALLNVSSAIENDKVLRASVSLRIFLRTDIARWGFENFEQQSHGKRLELSWSSQTILNFVLSRLPNYSWIAATFPGVVKFVRCHESEIQQDNVPEMTCLEQMLRMLPAKLGRLNLNTTTFLRTYFSDDPSGLQSYYPRVYDKFLQSIDAAKRPLVGGRVGQDVIMAAHDESSADFLTQVRQELRFLVPLDERNLDRFISALKEKRTPFARKTLASTIRNSLKIPMPDIDATLEAMKEIGIFEQHPSRPDHWRVGRLFKSALKMKYGAVRN